MRVGSMASALGVAGYEVVTVKASEDWFIYDVDEHSFRPKVLDASRDHLVMVDFWAEWCSPCRVLTPVLEKVASEFDGKVLLAKVEVDENMRLAGHYKLRGFPTVIFFWAGEPLDRFAGYKPVHTVRELVAEHLVRYAGIDVSHQMASGQ